MTVKHGYRRVARATIGNVLVLGGVVGYVLGLFGTLFLDSRWLYVVIIGVGLAVLGVAVQ